MKWVLVIIVAALPHQHTSGAGTAYFKTLDGCSRVSQFLTSGDIGTSISEGEYFSVEVRCQMNLPKLAELQP